MVRKTERKTSIGVAESEMLSEFLELVARDYEQIITTPDGAIDEFAIQMRNKYAKKMVAECRDWAETVKPIPVGGYK